MNACVPPLQSLFESLETRQLLAASPLAIIPVQINGGTQLQVLGGKRADHIVVAPVAGGFQISNGAWSSTVNGVFDSILVRAGRGNDVVTIDPAITIPAILFGGVGDDSLTCGASDDKLYGQGGADMLNGGAGDDILVNAGDSRFDQAAGGDGFDSLWTDSAASEQVTDASADEIAQGAVHRIGR